VNPWDVTCRAALADPTLRGLARAIFAANRRGDPDRTAYGAFRDRVQDLGLSVPNEAYWSILTSVVIADAVHRNPNT
jgi:hypothetical protein